MAPHKGSDDRSVLPDAFICIRKSISFTQAEVYFVSLIFLIDLTIEPKAPLSSLALERL